MKKEDIKLLALKHGFKLKEQPDGSMDLNPYVYEFVKDILSQRQEDEPVAEIVSEDVGSPFGAAVIRSHFYKGVPPVGTKLYTRPDGLRKVAEEAVRNYFGWWKGKYGKERNLDNTMRNLRSALEDK